MTKKELQDALDAMTQRAETAERSSKGRKENIIEIGGKLLRMTERAEAAEEEANRLRLEVAGIPALLQLARAEERERAEARVSTAHADGMVERLLDRERITLIRGLDRSTMMWLELDKHCPPVSTEPVLGGKEWSHYATKDTAMKLITAGAAMLRILGGE